MRVHKNFTIVYKFPWHIYSMAGESKILKIYKVLVPKKAMLLIKPSAYSLQRTASGRHWAAHF